MAGRTVRFERTCDLAAEHLGGYERIDDSLSAYYDALHRNPEGFDKVTTDWGSVRYIHTRPIGDTPSLIWHFTIEPNGDVAIVHVELYD